LILERLIEMKKGTGFMRKVAGFTAVAMLLSLGIPSDVNAAESVTANNAFTVSNSVATPGDADGAYLNQDGYYYYYENGSILKKSGWLELGTGEALKLDGSYRIMYRLELDGSKKIISRYDIANKEFTLYENDIIELSDGRLYFAGEKGVISSTNKTISDGKGNTYICASGGVITGRLVKKGTAIYCYTYSETGHKWNQVKNTYKKVDSNRIYLFGSNGVKLSRSGWYTLKSGDSVLVGKNGYVTAKLTKKGDARRYYAYDYCSNTWKQKKNQWITVGNIQYYFASSGVAKYSYNTKTSKMNQYSNGKFAAARKSAVKLGNGRIYYFGSTAVKSAKAGWFDLSSKDKVCVGNKGYITMKFSTKSGKLYKYNYSKKKWELVKVTSYKIGKKTYYFDSNGVVAKNKIVGNKKSGYFYVDSTGCKVTSKEIKMAVNFVMKHKKKGMSNSDILHSCYREMATYGYQRDYVVPDVSRFPDLSCDTLKNKYGNCYRFASTFACVATVLGYKARVTCGMVPAVYGNGQTIHGWAEVWNTKDKAWKVYDVNMQRVWTEQEISFYNQFISDYYPGRHSVDFRVGLTVKNGTAKWSKLQ